MRKENAMKKIIPILLIIVATLGLTSCSKNEELKKEDFIGRWDATAYFDKDTNYPDDYDRQAKLYKKYTIDEPEEAVNYISLDDDGFMEVCYQDEKFYGIWKLENNEIIFKDSDTGKTLDKYIIDKNNKRLVLKMDDKTAFVYEK